MKHNFIFLILVAICLGCSSCAAPQAQPAPDSAPVGDSQLNMPNPAAVYCEEQGYRVEIRTAADGSQSGACIFPDGSECDEWAYFRGECSPPSQSGVPDSAPVGDSQLNMPNPAAVYCEEQGYRVEIRTAADGSQSGACIFPDGSECDEWAYFRGECSPPSQSAAPDEIPAARPIDPADYQGWWTYTHPVYNFSIMLPEDWTVEEIASNEPLLDGHILNLHPKAGGDATIRMTFRHLGEDVLLWPTGVGQGEFIQQGTLDVAGQPAQRILLVCPTGEVTSIWYYEAEGTPASQRSTITRGDMEFGFIYRAGEHCTPGLSLNGKIQYVGEMIIASLKAQ